MSTEPSLRDLMVARADNPDGATAADFAIAIERKALQVQPHIYALESQKRLFRAHRAGQKLRFFAKVEYRDAWLMVKSVGQTCFTTGGTPKLVDVHQHIKSRARKPGLKPLALMGSETNRKAQPAPVNIDGEQFKRVGDLVVNDETIFSFGRSYSHDPRVQCGPEEHIPALFSAQRYGEYIEPASTWAAAAARG